MRLVKIGVASVSVKVGDFNGNLERLCAVVGAARAQHVDLLVTPELAISGYSLEDRVWWRDVARRSWEALRELAKHCPDISVFVGLPVRTDQALRVCSEVRTAILKPMLRQTVCLAAAPSRVNISDTRERWPACISRSLSQ